MPAIAHSTWRPTPNAHDLWIQSDLVSLTTGLVNSAPDADKHEVRSGMAGTRGHNCPKVQRGTNANVVAK